MLNLLDQMKREDQDFKVWERDDYSFLRWYVTKQMETLHGKVDNLKFIEMMNGDFEDYVNKMSQDGVPIDKVFIQAAATIFNKDIILIPVDGETDYDVIVGGRHDHDVCDWSARMYIQSQPKSMNLARRPLGVMLFGWLCVERRPRAR